MRELKFRAWDKIEGKMWNPIIKPDGVLMAANLLGGYEAFHGESDPVMQYTGLKDIKGKEIYEGDILKETYSAGYSIFSVRFGGYDNGLCYEDSDRGIGWYIKSIAEYYGGSLCEPSQPEKSILHHHEEMEVIGNIYENPELLESKDETKN